MLRLALAAAACLALTTVSNAHRLTPAAPPAAGDKAGGDYGGYLTYPEIKAQIADWKRRYPTLVHEGLLGATWEGRPIPLLRLSPDRTPAPDKPEVLLMAGIHPREQQPQVCLMRFLGEVLSGYGEDPRMTRLLRERTLWVVPVLNVDGKVYDMAPDTGGNGTTQGADWRKNRRPNGDKTVGTDLNRNFAVRWGGSRGIDPLWKTSTLDTAGNIYEGPAPLSEPESRALARFIVSRPNLRAFLDMHSPLRNFAFPAYLTRREWERYTGLLNGMRDRQKSDPYPLTKSYPDEEPGTDARGGNTGLTYTWAYYTRGVYGVNFEISDPARKTGIEGRYPPYESILREYETHVREPLLHFVEASSELPAARPGTLRCDGPPTLSNPAVPGASLTLTPPPPTGGPCEYGVLVSPSPDAVVTSEYRRVPFKSGFSISISKSVRPGAKVPLTLYLWDAERRVTTVPLALEIGQSSAPSPPAR